MAAALLPWLAACQAGLSAGSVGRPESVTLSHESALTQLDGGWGQGDAWVFFEAYYADAALRRIAERVEQGDEGIRRTDYYFREGLLRAVISDAWEMAPEDGRWRRRQFRLALSDGQFEQGRQWLDGKPQRLRSDIISLVRNEARLLQQQLQQLQAGGERLWRGQWNGEQFSPCHPGGEGRYQLVASRDDWDWLNSFSDRLRQQGTRQASLMFLGQGADDQGTIEMTQLISLQPASHTDCEPLAPLVWTSLPVGEPDLSVTGDKQ